MLKDVALNVHHLGVVGQHVVGWAPVAFKYRSSGSAASLYPSDPFLGENLMDRRAVFGSGTDHPSDDRVEGMLMMRIPHKVRRTMQFPASHRSEKVARRRSRTPVALAQGRRPLTLGVDLIIARSLIVIETHPTTFLDRHPILIPRTRAPRTPRQAWHITHVAGSQPLPRRAIIRQLDIPRNLQHDQTQGKDIGRLVILAKQDLGTDIFAIAFALDARLGGEGSRHAKVADFENAFKRDEDIGRLKVEVNEAGVVDVAETLFLC
jgi:hypothetical protein